MEAARRATQASSDGGRCACVGLTDTWSTSICLFHAIFGGECAEVELLDKVYSLYIDVITTVAEWKDYAWSDVPAELGAIAAKGARHAPVLEPDEADGRVPCK